MHSHLDHHYFKDDLDKVIENARKAGVKVILTAGINSETNRKALEIAEIYSPIVSGSSLFCLNSTHSVSFGKAKICCVKCISCLVSMGSNHRK